MNPNPDAQDTATMPRYSPSNPAPAESGTRRLPSGTIPTNLLFQGSQEILISHNGEHYRLRITKNGKLILTK